VATTAATIRMRASIRSAISSELQARTEPHGTQIRIPRHWCQLPLEERQSSGITAENTVFS